MSSAHDEASVVQERSKKSKDPIVTTITDALDIELTKRGVLAHPVTLRFPGAPRGMPRKKQASPNVAGSMIDALVGLRPYENKKPAHPSGSVIP